MTGSGNRGWCSDLSDRVRVIRDNDVWRVTERSCFDEFREKRLVEMLERRVKSATAFFDFVLAVFPGEGSRSPFFFTRLSISRISFYEIVTVTAYCNPLCKRLFFLKNRILLSKLIPFGIFPIFFFSIEKKLDRFLLILLYYICLLSQNKKRY